MKEVWKKFKIFGWEDYEISNKGKVRLFKKGEYQYRKANGSCIVLYSVILKYVRTFSINKLIDQHFGDNQDVQHVETIKYTKQGLELVNSTCPKCRKKHRATALWKMCPACSLLLEYREGDNFYV